MTVVLVARVRPVLRATTEVLQVIRARTVKPAVMVAPVARAALVEPAARQVVRAARPAPMALVEMVVPAALRLLAVTAARALPETFQLLMVALAVPVGMQAPRVSAVPVAVDRLRATPARRAPRSPLAVTVARAGLELPAACPQYPATL